MRADATRNRARILEVARELIGREGPSVSMDAIAAEAGVAVGTLYRHHPTKAALVEAVIGRSIDQLAEAAEDALGRGAGGPGAGEELARLFRVVAARYPVDEAVKQAAGSLGAQAPHPGSGPDGGFGAGTPELRAWRAFTDLLRAAQDEGTIRADLTPLDLLALLAGVPTGGVPESVRDRYVDVVIAGCRALGPGSDQMARSRPSQ